MSIRTRLNLWYTGLLAVALLAFGTMLYSLLAGALTLVLDDRLAAEAHGIVSAIQSQNDPLELLLSVALCCLLAMHFPRSTISKSSTCKASLCRCRRTCKAGGLWSQPRSVTTSLPAAPGPLQSTWAGAFTYVSLASRLFCSSIPITLWGRYWLARAWVS